MITPLGLYIHIPFCRQKCHYCDFLSFPKSQKLEDEYFEKLNKEIAHYGSKFKIKYIVDSIFIGGGTPSIVDSKNISDLIRNIGKHFSVSDNCEITIEVNPGTVDFKKLRDYRVSGVNRLSIGAQSFNNSELRYLGRSHSDEHIRHIVSMARQATFENINLDLMFGFPNQTLSSFEHSIWQATKLEISHISLYSLEILENTKIYNLIRRGESDVDEELDRQLYHRGIEILDDLGFRQYEISNFSKKDMECRHNLKYWNFDEYLGLGLGSSSFMQGVRWKNTFNVEEYISSSFDIIRKDLHINTIDDSISEYMFTVLRKNIGIDVEKFNSMFDVDMFLKYPIEKHIENGYLKYDGRFLSLTTKGMDFSNQVFMYFV